MVTQFLPAAQFYDFRHVGSGEDDPSNILEKENAKDDVVYQAHQEWWLIGLICGDPTNENDGSREKDQDGYKDIESPLALGAIAVEHAVNSLGPAQVFRPCWHHVDFLSLALSPPERGLNDIVSSGFVVEE